MTVVRNGNLNTFSIHIDDILNSKIKKYINFAGANFHELNNITKSFLSSNVDGIYQTSATPASVFKKAASTTNIVLINLTNLTNIN